MSRHPYTYAADYVRALGPVCKEGVVLSRSDAAKIVEGIAKVLGLDAEEVKTKLSLAEQNKSHEEVEAERRRLLIAMGYLQKED
jgi:hypothetical protein